MTVLLDTSIERTLDAWVREFEQDEYRGAYVQAWLFEDEAARRAAERRLAAARGNGGVPQRLQTAGAFLPGRDRCQGA